MFRRSRPRESGRRATACARLARQLSGSAGAVLLAYATTCAGQAADRGASSEAYGSVDPHIGTSNGGNTYPGATLPFGMIQWSPDTGEGFYYADQHAIHGFSLTHLSGAGCPVFADMPILPWSHRPPADRANIPLEASPFNRAQETAHPGTYQVTLADGTSVELAVTERAGIARLRFPAGARAGLLVNAAGSANADVHMAKLPPVGREHDGESLAVQADGTLLGTVTSGGFCGSPTRYTLHVAFALQHAPVTIALWQDGQATAATQAKGKRASAWVDLGPGREYLVKVGLSYVSEGNAAANLHAEIPGWDFELIRRRAEATWTQALDSVNVQTDSRSDRTVFYTALYHNLLAPNLFSDGNGEYMGFDGQVHRLPPGQRAQYATFSDWDIYRNTTPLQAWLRPEAASDMAQSLVNDAEQMGSLPRWAIANDSSYVMGGDSPAILLAEFNAFGATHFNRGAALEATVRAATVPGLGLHQTEERTHLPEYLRLGYLPANPKSDEWDISASETLKDANADFAISQFAQALGHQEQAATFLKRAGNWHNLLDPETHWIRPRYADGRWLPGFDPERSLPHTVKAPVPTDQFGFQEGNTYQYSFMVPFDYRGLFDSMGSDALVEQRLDRFFTKLVCWAEPCFNMANEPDFVTPYAYTFLGKPGKTADVVTRIENGVFNTTPGGIPGNDDLGATSAVFLWNALGLYPAIPGAPGVVLGVPRFERATIRLGGDRQLTIERIGEGRHVQAVELNGKPWRSSWLPLPALSARHSTLRFHVADVPSSWATAPADLPPSFPAGKTGQR